MKIYLFGLRMGRSFIIRAAAGASAIKLEKICSARNPVPPPLGWA
jgi:hypothetical protein